jgi:redox-sensitive bicupin YhaK (pirin superfamily)
LSAGAHLSLPDHEERAIYVVSGGIRSGGETLTVGQMGICSPGDAELAATEDAHVVLLGGTPLDGPRHIWWDFVSSSAERIEEAKREWALWSDARGGGARFAPIPGDRDEHIPLPER